MKPQIQVESEKQLDWALRHLGGGEAVTRFLNSYGNVRTKKAYAVHLAVYFEWLRDAKKVALSPEELVHDNLVSIFKSDPVDVGTKAKHKRWLEEYVNVHMVEKGRADPTRLVRCAAVRKFYDINESPLHGALKVARRKDAQVPPPLTANDIRKVLKALSPQVRTPCFASGRAGAR